MKVEQTAAGLERRLEVTGILRFIPVAFLTFWLAGWAVGECFALWVLGKGALSLLSGHLGATSDHPGSIVALLGAGLFLIVWLTLWTFGGIAAGRELLRLLFGRDVFVTRSDGLEIQHHYGLFRTVKVLPRTELRRLYRLSPYAPLRVETTSGTVELTRVGTPAERTELEQALNSDFGLQAEAKSPLIGALPKGWCEILSLEHDPVLIKDPGTRRKQARLAWIM